jgi:LuxR family maltose regulon positive regulatory protein
VQQAILLAANGHLSFCFLEEGEPIRALMAQGAEFSTDADRVSEHSFLEQLTTAFALQAPSISPPAAEVPALASGNSHDAAAEPLSSREIEILRLAERSMLGKEIADQLNLTHGTVKWYMQQIYDKLGVRRRLVAIQRARSLGYLR